MAVDAFTVPWNRWTYVHIYFSTFQPDPTGDWQVGERWGGRTACCPKLADGGMVSPPEAFTDRTAHSATQRQADAYQGSSPTPLATTTNGSDVIGEAIQAQVIYGKTAEIYRASWRQTTQRQYTTYLKKWKRFCLERNFDPFRPVVTVVLTSLT